MHIHCPECEAGIDAKDIALDRGVAKCGRCQAVFSIVSQLEAAGVPFHNTSAKPIIAEPPAPLHVEVDAPKRLLVSWRWFIWMGFFLVGITAVFGFAARDFFWGLFDNFGNEPRGTEIARVAIIVAFASLVFSPGYAGLAILLNSTTVELAEGKLSIRHGPLPWLGNQEIDASEITQLYVGWDQPQNQEPRFRLMARLRDGSILPLVPREPDLEILLWLERQLETKLGIEDIPMQDEVY